MAALGYNVPQMTAWPVFQNLDSLSPTSTDLITFQFPADQPVVPYSYHDRLAEEGILWHAPDTSASLPLIDSVPLAPLGESPTQVPVLQSVPTLPRDTKQRCRAKVKYQRRGHQPTLNKPRFYSPTNDANSLQEIPESNEASIGPIPLSTSDKHTRRKVRNRRAATKCRRKAQASNAQLEAQAQEACGQHKLLSEQYRILREEVLYLKNEMLQQAYCTCPLMTEYLRNSALRIVERCEIGHDG